MNIEAAALSPVEFFRSDDFDFRCGCCGRAVKRAVVLSDGLTRGVDCAATAMGRAKSRRAFDAIEVEARTVSAQNQAAGYITLSPKPSRKDAGYAAYMEQARAVCPYAEHSIEWHAFFAAV